MAKKPKKEENVILEDGVTLVQFNTRIPLVLRDDILATKPSGVSVQRLQEAMSELCLSTPKQVRDELLLSDHSEWDSQESAFTRAVRRIVEQIGNTDPDKK